MTERPSWLPGDQPKSTTVERAVRVDHAGEYGAQRIYAGQLAVLKDHACAPVIEHMKEQEEVHLAAFENEIATRNISKTALLPLWHVAGYALGAGTALMGEKAAMACTVAVEEVIDQHYAKQLEQLPEEETALKANIEKFREEELEHRDIGLAHNAEQATAYPLLTAAIKAGSHAAIWLSERV